MWEKTLRASNTVTMSVHQLYNYTSIEFLIVGMGLV